MAQLKPDEWPADSEPTMEEREASGTAVGVALLRAAHQLIDGEPKILDDPVSPRLFYAEVLHGVRKDRHLPEGPLPLLRKFYYELAQGNTRAQIGALLQMAPVSQVLYGTDFPFRGGAEVNGGIAAYGFGADDVRSIERETALKLMPQLKT